MILLHKTENQKEAEMKVANDNNNNNLNSTHKEIATTTLSN